MFPEAIVPVKKEVLFSSHVLTALKNAVDYYKKVVKAIQNDMSPFCRKIYITENTIFAACGCTFYLANPKIAIEQAIELSLEEAAQIVKFGISKMRMEETNNYVHLIFDASKAEKLKISKEKREIRDLGKWIKEVDNLVNMPLKSSLKIVNHSEAKKVKDGICVVEEERTVVVSSHFISEYRNKGEAWFDQEELLPYKQERITAISLQNKEENVSLNTGHAYKYVHAQIFEKREVNRNEKILFTKSCLPFVEYHAICFVLYTNPF